MFAASYLFIYSYFNNAVRAMPYFRRLVAGFPPRYLGFETRSGHLGFCDEQSRYGAGFLTVQQFPTIILILPTVPLRLLVILKVLSSPSEQIHECCLVLGFYGFLPHFFKVIIN
jgi:hypothetical protein